MKKCIALCEINKVAVPLTCDGRLINCKNKADPVHAIKADAIAQFISKIF